ncbi:hypothetical protein EH223_06910 [candidate division KSB1 bacterium]|nr:hypothetical protein [candidate division KSB1 bacterium]RQW04719.1 MAG: hypothetical protein EH223_06910 [candidate division KSB1 bacterium]
MQKLLITLLLVWKMIRYNLKIVFANKFIYFMLTAVAIFLLITVINLFDPDSNPNVALVYYWLMVPGILLIFYPAVFGIQNDADSRMLEILFGIPNYRYKVWLVRLAVIYVIVFLMLFILAFLSSLALVSFNVFYMVYELMYPIFFLGCLSFMFSTVVRNGYGTAVFLVIIGLVFWILSGALMESQWNLFLNPFHVPQNVSEMVWEDLLVKNRIYQLVGIAVFILIGLLNMQKREKFV